MGNGYKGVMPDLSGRQRLYLEATGLAVSTEAYKNLCDWFNRDKKPPRGKAECQAMQQEMLAEVFPDMMEAGELAEYLKLVFADDKAVLAELLIRRYGLNEDDEQCRKMAEIVPEIAREYGYAESTVKTMLPKAIDALRRDTHFREALQVPELSSSLFNYWRFVRILLTRASEDLEQIGWDEETATALGEQLQEVGARDLANMDQAVKMWLGTLPEEVRLATQLKYGLGYPLIGRSNDYVMAASGFGEWRELLDFLWVKLNRASLCTLFGVDITEVDYNRLKAEFAIVRSDVPINELGLPLKVALKLGYEDIHTANELLKIDMFSEEEQPWSKQVPSKYWRDVVQLWTDLRIKYELDDYRFDGCYAYEKVS